VRGGPRAGRQLVDGGGRVILHAREHVGEVVEGIDRTRLACGNERVEAGDARAGVAAVDEEVVLPVERNSKLTLPMSRFARRFTIRGIRPTARRPTLSPMRKRERTPKTIKLRNPLYWSSDRFPRVDPYFARQLAHR
jgi:hypothetical protein